MLAVSASSVIVFVSKLKLFPQGAHLFLLKNSFCQDNLQQGPHILLLFLALFLEKDKLFGVHKTISKSRGAEDSN